MILHFNKDFDLKIKASFLNDESTEDLKNLKNKELFTGKAKSMFLSLDTEAKGSIFLGLGDKSKLEVGEIIESFFLVAKKLKELKVKEASLLLPEEITSNEDLLKAAFEGFLQAEYSFDTYKTKKDDEDVEITLDLSLDGVEDTAAFEVKFNQVKNLVDGINITRNLVNLPANDMYPETLAEKTVEIFRDTNVSVEVLDKKQCEELGMEAMLQVARGSAKEPKFIILRYMPETDKKEHLTFVGKGLTYDSGGYALKPANSMVTMKSDMGGAAAVIGAMYALEQNKVEKNVVGVIAAVENLISGDAYKNGDIIGSMKGTTIEIGNTDAEGRVTLADSLYYAATKLNSTAIVDLATLTGACIVALGDRVTGLVSNNDDLSDLIIKSSLKANEPTWRFPVFDIHRELVKGKYADLTNSAGGGGSITAGVFLEHFVEELPWVHMDIAGPSWSDNGYKYIPSGGSGVPVKTIYEFAKIYDK